MELPPPSPPSDLQALSQLQQHLHFRGHSRPLHVRRNASTTPHGLGKLQGLRKEAAKISIIKGVSGIIKPFRLTLLLGPPGCGKTTLLLVLAGKFNIPLKVSGEISYNGCKLEEFISQKTWTYISQYDLHISEMTVREILTVTGQPEGYGFIEFASHEAAQRILQTYNGTLMPGTEHLFRLNWASFGLGERRADAGPEHSIIVVDLALDVTDYLLQETFRVQYPSVRGAKVVTDPNTGRSQGYGFVKFADEMERNRGINCKADYPQSRPQATGFYVSSGYNDKLLRAVYWYQVCQSLAYFHNVVGVCHLDANPQHLIVNPHSHQLKRCEFGSAKKLIPGCVMPELLLMNPGYACSYQKCFAQSIFFMHKDWMSSALVSKIKSLADRRKLEYLTIGSVFKITTDSMLKHNYQLFMISEAKLLCGGGTLANHSISAIYGAMKPAAIFVSLVEIVNVDHFDISGAMTDLLKSKIAGMDEKKKTVVVLGTGWAGTSFLKNLDSSKYDGQVVSPRNYFALTPFLPSVTCGTVAARSIAEPIRKIIEQKSGQIKFWEAECVRIDPKSRKGHCRSNHAGAVARTNEFEVDYDYLVIAMGARVNTFNTLGVTKNCHFLKEVEAAQRIRRSVMDYFERTNLPDLTEEERKKKLHFIVVGGGPTGVAFAAVLHDCVTEDLVRLYQNCTTL